MNIALVAGLSVTIDSFFTAAIARWEADGHHVFVATSDGRCSTHTRITGLSRRPHPRNLAAAPQLRRWVADNSIDLVVTNTATASFVARTRSLGAPVVYFCHGLHWDGAQRPSHVWEAAERLALRHTAGVVVMNQHDQDWFAARGERPLVRLPHGVGLDPQQYPRTPMPAHEGGLRLAWVGEFSGRKRPLDAIRIVAELHGRGVPVALTMLGDGPLRAEAAKLAHSLGVREHIDFAGFQPAYPVLASSHCVLHTASWEGLPRVGLEAAAVGRRFYGFDVKGVRDLPHATVVEPFDVTALVSALERGLADVPETPDLDPQELSADHAADVVLEFLEQIHLQA